MTVYDRPDTPRRRSFEAARAKARAHAAMVDRHIKRRLAERQAKSKQEDRHGRT